MFIQYCCNCHYYKYILKIGRLIGICFFWSSNNRYWRWKIIISRPLIVMTRRLWDICYNANTVYSESIPTPSLFPHFITLQPSFFPSSIYTRGRPIMIFQRRYRLLEDQKKQIPINLPFFKNVFVLMTITTILNEHLF